MKLKRETVAICSISSLAAIIAGFLMLQPSCGKKEEAETVLKIPIQAEPVEPEAFARPINPNPAPAPESIRRKKEDASNNTDTPNLEIPNFEIPLVEKERELIANSISNAAKTIDFSALESPDNPLLNWGLKGDRKFRILNAAASLQENIDIAKITQAAGPGVKVVTVLSEPEGMESSKKAGDRVITHNQQFRLDSIASAALQKALKAGDPDALSKQLATILQSQISSVNKSPE